jgi:hypothetical protein
MLVEKEAKNETIRFEKSRDSGRCPNGGELNIKYKSDFKCECKTECKVNKRWEESRVVALLKRERTRTMPEDGSSSSSTLGAPTKAMPSESFLLLPPLRF